MYFVRTKEIRIMSSNGFNVAEEVMKGDFELSLAAYIRKAGTKCLLLTRERYAAYVECIDAFASNDPSRIRSARENPLCTYYQVRDTYRLRRWLDPTNGSERVMMYAADKKLIARGILHEDGSVAEIDSVPRIAIVEEAYGLIRKAHETTHHLKAKITYQELKKTISNISEDIVEMYVRCCAFCAANTRKKSTGAKSVHRPIYTKGFNTRGQVDLVDMRSLPDKLPNGVTYVWIMHYQDHATKYCVLRALPDKEGPTVARALLEIFSMHGFPCILQSDNGREFVNAVLAALLQMSPDTKTIRGRPYYPQSQGSVERGNGQIKVMLDSWMRTRETTNWSLGIHFVQMEKNSAWHRGIHNAPYTVVFGHVVRRGLRAGALIPPELLKDVDDEDALTALLSSQGVGFTVEDAIEDQFEQAEADAIKDGEDHEGAHAAEEEQPLLTHRLPDSSSSVDPSLLTPVLRRTEDPSDSEPIHISEEELHISASTEHFPSLSVCPECNKNCETGVHKCGHCGCSMHTFCGAPWLLNEAGEEEECHGARRICTGCSGVKVSAATTAPLAVALHAGEDGSECDSIEDLEPGRRGLQRAAYEHMKKQGEKMKKARQNPPLVPGSVVKVPLPPAYRGPTDPPCIVGVVVHIGNGGRHRIAFKNGVLRTTMYRADLEEVLHQTPEQHGLEDVVRKWASLPLVDLNAAAKKISICRGFGETCNCKGKCNTKHCDCVSSNRLCSSLCHPHRKDGTCLNRK